MFQIQLEVEVKFVQDQLKGDDTTELRIKFIKKLEDVVPAGDDWQVIKNSSFKSFHSL